jgi:hypothetical protein
MRLVLPIMLTFQFSILDGRIEILRKVYVSLHEGLRSTVVHFVNVETEFDRIKCDISRRSRR